MMIKLQNDDTKYVMTVSWSPVSWMEVNIRATEPKNSNAWVMDDNCPVLPFL